MADRETEIVIRPAVSGEGLPDGDYRVTVFPMETAVGQEPQRLKAAARDGALRMRVWFTGEQEHVQEIVRVAGDVESPVGTCRVYALATDLFALRPWKGDRHMHSNRSDGGEDPGHVAMACRRIGLDFMALTDHRQYAPSLEAAVAFAGVPIDLRIYPGEEVHPPDPACPIHVVNFGGRGDHIVSIGRRGSPPRRHAARLWSLPPGQIRPVPPPRGFTRPRRPLPRRRTTHARPPDRRSVCHHEPAGTSWADNGALSKVLERYRVVGMNRAVVENNGIALLPVSL